MCTACCVLPNLYTHCITDTAGLLHAIRHLLRARLVAGIVCCCRGLTALPQALASFKEHLLPQVAAVTHMGRAMSFIWLSTLPASPASSQTREKQPTRWPYL